MRSSDWSSDVCSSELVGGPHRSVELLPAQRTRHGVGRQSTLPRGGGRMHETSSTDAPTEGGTQDPSFLPALRFEPLTHAYAAIVRLTHRKRVVTRPLRAPPLHCPPLRLPTGHCDHGTIPIH